MTKQNKTLYERKFPLSLLIVQEEIDLTRWAINLTQIVEAMMKSLNDYVKEKLERNIRNERLWMELAQRIVKKGLEAIVRMIDSGESIHMTKTQVVTTHDYEKNKDNVILMIEGYRRRGEKELREELEKAERRIKELETSLELIRAKQQ